jgi:hypothetical protein
MNNILFIKLYPTYTISKYYKIKMGEKEESGNN